MPYCGTQQGRARQGEPEGQNVSRETFTTEREQVNKADIETGVTYKVTTPEGGVDFVHALRWEDGYLVALMPSRVGEVHVDATYFTTWEKWTA